MNGIGPRIFWYVEVRVHSLLFREPLAFGPWLFSSRSGADAFLYRLFAPPLVAWARRRLLEWPQGCIDPPDDKERLELLRDHRMLEQLHDFYRTEKDAHGFNYWTWTIQPFPLVPSSESEADAFLKHMGSEFSDFQ